MENIIKIDKFALHKIRNLKRIALKDARKAWKEDELDDWYAFKLKYNAYRSAIQIIKECTIIEKEEKK